ncbi:MAG: hypothetical protein LAO03_16050 [Acidobacteriia bacterium]|nr:hypothetical protein [Terriglobia bacterium]
MNDAPKLLVEWSSPWEEFLSALGPALGRSPERLAGEARVGLFPYRGMLVSWVLEAALLVVVIVVPAKLATLRTFAPPPMPKYDVIYFSGDELPRTEDRGGAKAGRSGRAGGQEAHHRTQTIRVARGDSLREKVVDAPKLNLPKSDSDVANLLAYKPIPGPAPTEGLKSSLRAPALPDVAAVAPAPQVNRNKIPAAPALNAGVIPPAPVANAATMRLPGSQAVEVIPPPVSAPEQVTNLNPKLTLPMPTVVAPPPQVTRDVASLGPGFGAGDMHKQVIPPPAQLSGNTISSQHATVGGLGAPSVVPPPAQIGGGSLSHQPVSGLGGGVAVVPPPPTVSGGSSLSGRGRGNQGTGLGGPLDVGVAAAPPKGGGGSVGGTGIVVSSQPGSKVGVPGNGGTGSLAMSPSGGSKPGLGGSGGGTGIGRGNGPGSGLAGEGSGAAKEGTGRGSDAMAKGGISPYPGPGGAGSGTSGTPAMPGVSVRGGSNNVVTLPSFGSDAGQPNGPGRSATGSDRHSPGITIVATSRSGGAFNFYGALKGDNYSIYIETALGTAVMQFADPTSVEHSYAEAMVAPEPLRTDLPAGLPRARLIIACILDRSGLLKNTRVLEPGPAEMTSKVLAALPNWKFQPVLRGGQPIEVNAILGFNIDTR